jgi:hypothetical protein
MMYPASTTIARIHRKSQANTVSKICHAQIFANLQKGPYCRWDMHIGYASAFELLWSRTDHSRLKFRIPREIEIRVMDTCMYREKDTWMMIAMQITWCEYEYIQSTPPTARKHEDGAFSRTVSAFDDTSDSINPKKKIKMWLHTGVVTRVGNRCGRSRQF